jgi:long-subunit acyl-CoA synthetase (AMP-forming)
LQASGFILVLTMSEALTAHKALLEWADKTPDRVFLHQPVHGQLRETTWREAADSSRRVAQGLLSLELKPGDKVAILAKNSAEWILADVAIAMAGLISVPVYPTAGADTISHVLRHSEARGVFVGQLDDHETAVSALPASIPRIAFPYVDITDCQFHWQDLIDNNAVLENLAEPRADDVMTILYTSGSTGLPKGVVITFGAYHYACRTSAKCIDVDSSDHLFSYLPLAHITERTCTAGPAIYCGSECSFVESLKSFPDDLRRASPTIFISVPRLWVKFQSGVHAKIPPRKLRLLLALPIIGKQVAKKIRAGLGFDNCRSWGSGTAPISPATLIWYHKLGVNIGEGWGMSETSGLSCGNVPFTAAKLGTIGAPIEGTEMKLSDEEEILIRSPGLFREYYKQPELTQEVFTEDGFFHTGDKAKWDESLQAYTITGRIKDIFKSAKGKYVTPVPIESRLSANPLFEQVCVMGAGLRAPVAVVVLAEAALYIQKEDIKTSCKATLESVNATLESHEKLSNIVIVCDEWTTENNLLTPTLKVKRDKLEEKYNPLISQEFGEAIEWEEPAD